jgi:hypothetical protein
LHILKGDGTVHKTNVTALARQISIELKEKFIILDQNVVFMEKGELDTGQINNPEIINTVFDAVENLMGGE